MRQGKMKEGAEYTNTLLKQVSGRSKIKGGKVFWNVVILEPGRGSVPESKFYRKSEPVVYLPHATYTRKKTKSPGLSQLRPVKYGSQSESAKAWAEQQLFKR